MDMKRERLVWGSVLAVLVFVVVFLLASSSDTRTADNLLLSLIALSILIVSVTISVAIGAICLRLLRPNDSAATTSHLEGQVPIVAGPIALFGILITGVFVITTFRIDTGARQIAREAVDTILPALTMELRTEAVEEAMLLADSARRAERENARGIESVLQVEVAQEVEVVADRTLRFRLEGTTGGTYRIDAMGIEGFDPFIYIYAATDEDPLS